MSDWPRPHFGELLVCDAHVVAPATNTEPDFVGVDAIAEKHRAQVQQFCDWAAAHDWAAFHSHHYDWWTFPIDAPSSFGFGYTVYETERAQLTAAPGFLNTLEEAARLLLLSWGWDAITNAPVAHPEPNQSWQHWPIRWSKCARSLELFGLTEMHASCIAYGRHLRQKGESFQYRGRDLGTEHGI